MDGFEFCIIGVQDIALIKPLWEKLRVHHRSKTEHFRRYYDEMRFETRIEKFLDPGLRVRIELCVPAGGGDVVGYCVSSLTGAGNGEIDSIFVEESCRRRGIAGMLVRGALDWLDNEGAGEIRVMVSAGNGEALAFYDRFGLCPAYTVLKMKPAE